MAKKLTIAQKNKKNEQVIGKEALLKEKEDVEGLKTHLEEEYRKANISEKNYSELKEKYEKKLKEIDEKVVGTEKEVVAKKKPKAEPTAEPTTKIKAVTKPTTTPTTTKPTPKPSTPIPKPAIKEPKVESPVTERPPIEKPPIEKTAIEEREAPKSRFGFLNKIKGLFSNLSLRRRKKAEPGVKPAGEPEDLGLGQGGLDVGKEEKSEDEKLIEQAALAVGATQEGAASMIEGAKEKMAALSASGESQIVEEPSEAAGASSFTASQTAPGVAVATAPMAASGMEIEKLKVMIDSMRDMKRATDESLQTLAENIGEIRSMSFQSDGAVRELTTKIERIEDEIGEVRPTEISKKFREIDTAMEKRQLVLEKLIRKSEDLSEKTNKVYDMLKGAGGVENLININNEIQRKIKDIKDIIKYIERLAFKTEKVFIDLNKRVEDFTVYKTKQDDMEKSIKDLTKSVDKVNLELENYMTKSDADELRELIINLQKEMAEMNKTVPVLKAKLPEPITVLLQEKDDILLFLESLEENLKAKSISPEEYQKVKDKNMEKLDKINKALKKQWGRLEEYAKMSGIEKEAERIESERVEAEMVEREAATEEAPEEVPEPEEKAEIKEGEPKEEEEAEKVTEEVTEEMPKEEKQEAEEIPEETVAEEVAEEEKPTEVEEVVEGKEETAKEEEVAKEEVEKKPKKKKKKKAEKLKVEEQEPQKPVEAPEEEKPIEKKEEEVGERVEEQAKKEVKEEPDKEKIEILAEEKSEGVEKPKGVEGMSSLLKRLRTKMKEI